MGNARTFDTKKNIRQSSALSFNSQSDYSALSMTPQAADSVRHNFEAIPVISGQEPVAESCPIRLIPSYHPVGSVYHNYGTKVQAKRKIGQSNDIYEQEADRIAGQLFFNKPDDAVLPQIHSYSSYTPSRTSNAPSSVDRVLSSPGLPLPGVLQNEMEGHFGFTFSHVRIHHNPDSEESADDANAEAYTSGNHIVFGAGRYSPETIDGKRLLAHELTHVIQQSREGNGVIQLLIRTPYPWAGVIIPLDGADVWEAPDCGGEMPRGTVPQGQAVNVLGSSGDWLYVEFRNQSNMLEGYVHHTFVDDATSSSMEASVGTTMVWRPSGPGSGTDFETWASAATEVPFPNITAATVMNCWESVLLAAYQSGSIDWNWIHRLYVSTPIVDWDNVMSSRVSRHVYSIPGPNLSMPQRGDLVFFDGISHVALATGNGSEVYTFWPPPNTPFTPGGTTDRVKINTIEDIVAWWTTNMPPQPTVEFGAPSW